MTNGQRHWAVTLEDAHGNKFPMFIRAEAGYVMFTSTKFVFRADPDEADVIAPYVTHASDRAREQRRRS